MQNGNKTQNLFNSLAQRYDFFNDVISFGTHKIIKYLCVKNLSLKKGAKVLDLCTGTGDLAKYIKKMCPDTFVTGVDFSQNMLDIAKKRVKNAEFIQADVQNLPFEDTVFDTVVMGFGLRNIENRDDALKEVHRVLKNGGEFMHLDFGKGLKLPDAFFNTATPLLVKLLFGEKVHYEYLIKSKKEFPPPEELLKYFERYGFKYKCRKDYLFGIISAQVVIKI